VTFKNRDGSDRQAIIRKHCWPGMTVDLKREIGNKHDPNAIAAFISGRTL
jgi:hypothetical protein